MGGLVVALVVEKKPTVSNILKIVVVGKAKVTTVSKMRLVVGQGPFLRTHSFTRARVSKSSKVTILRRRDADG